ncbi:hypothetical protein E5D57_003600 [Metarhizium anisopliae]|nr:hypothetical protein E5D57_003600 [Metarhizium anisopliae]
MSDTESEPSLYNTEDEAGPILSKVWALILPHINEASEENWAIGISDIDDRNWTWWEMVKNNNGGFESRSNSSTAAPTTANNQKPVYLGEIARLDAVEMGSTIPWELRERPKSWTSREFVSEIWDTLYQDGALNLAEHDFGKQQLAAVFRG